MHDQITTEGHLKTSRYSLQTQSNISHRDLIEITIIPEDILVNLK